MVVQWVYNTLVEYEGLDDWIGDPYTLARILHDKHLE